MQGDHVLREGTRSPQCHVELKKAMMFFTETIRSRTLEHCATHLTLPEYMNSLDASTMILAALCFDNVRTILSCYIYGPVTKTVCYNCYRLSFTVCTNCSWTNQLKYCLYRTLVFFSLYNLRRLLGVSFARFVLTVSVCYSNSFYCSYLPRAVWRARAAVVSWSSPDLFSRSLPPPGTVPRLGTADGARSAYHSLRIGATFRCFFGTTPTSLAWTYFGHWKSSFPPR